MEIFDLSNDCQLLVCEMLNLPELLTLTEVNERFIPIVENILHRRFLKKSVTIVGLYPNGGKISQKFYTHETENDIRIQYFETATKLLKKFGYLVKNLRLEHYFMPSNDLTLIYQLVNLHCSKTLTELYMDNDVEDVLTEFIVPFEKVESVTLNGIFKRLHNDKLSFSGIFPALRKLTHKMGSILDMRWVDENIPHLEHVHVNIWKYGHVTGCFSEDVVIRLLKSNEQIKKLEFGDPTMSVLLAAHEYLPNLQNIEVHSFTKNEFEDIKFDNLNKISFI